MIHFSRTAVHLSIGCLLAVSALCADAAPTITSVNAAGAPGGTVSPALQYDFDAPYAVLSFGLQFSYDSSKLAFDAASSQVSIDGVTVSLGAVIATLPTSDYASNFGVDPVSGLAFGAFSYIPATVVGIDHQLIFRPAFQILGSPAAGPLTSVSFSGDLADDLTGVETTFSTAAAISVSAVPEPATWLSLGVGMLALGAATRRRHAA